MERDGLETSVREIEKGSTIVKDEMLALKKEKEEDDSEFRSREIPRKWEEDRVARKRRSVEQGIRDEERRMKAREDVAERKRMAVAETMRVTECSRKAEEERVVRRRMGEKRMELRLKFAQDSEAARDRAVTRQAKLEEEDAKEVVVWRQGREREKVAIEAKENARQRAKADAELEAGVRRVEGVRRRKEEAEMERLMGEKRMEEEKKAAAQALAQAAAAAAAEAEADDVAEAGAKAAAKAAAEERERDLRAQAERREGRRRIGEVGEVGLNGDSEAVVMETSQGWQVVDGQKGLRVGEAGRNSVSRYSGEGNGGGREESSSVVGNGVSEGSFLTQGHAEGRGVSGEGAMSIESDARGGVGRAEEEEVEVESREEEEARMERERVEAEVVAGRERRQAKRREEREERERVEAGRVRVEREAKAREEKAKKELAAGRKKEAMEFGEFVEKAEERRETFLVRGGVHISAINHMHMNIYLYNV